ncbi:MAG: hypothetical protein ACUVUF_08530 [Candidatus Bathycorpusculaceae bacterium]
MSEKKVVGRNVAIALGIICIVLAVGLVGAMINYTSIISGKDNIIASLNSQITDKDNTIASLNSRIANLQTQITDKDNTIASLNSRIANLQTQVNELNSIIDLEKSTVWVYDQTISQPVSSYTYWTFSASYAGYIVVTVHTSTTDKTYVRVIWSSYGVDYDESITVGASGTAVFPVLPASSIEVRVGNRNLLSGATEIVSITYHY